MTREESDANLDRLFHKWSEAYEEWKEALTIHRRDFIIPLCEAAVSHRTASTRVENLLDF